MSLPQMAVAYHCPSRSFWASPSMSSLGEGAGAGSVSKAATSASLMVIY